MSREVPIISEQYKWGHAQQCIVPVGNFMIFGADTFVDHGVRHVEPHMLKGLIEDTFYLMAHKSVFEMDPRAIMDDRYKVDSSFHEFALNYLRSRGWSLGMIAADPEMYDNILLAYDQVATELAFSLRKHLKHIFFTRNSVDYKLVKWVDDSSILVNRSPRELYSF